MLVEILLFLLLIFLGVYWYVTKHFGYFKKMGVPEAPGTFPFGSDISWKVWTGKESAMKFFEVEEFKDEKFYGMYSFGQRNLIIQDVELAKMIAIKDADHFVDRFPIGLKYNEVDNEIDKLFGLMITNITGDAWKKMRAMTSPVFTSGKLKLMVPHVNKCALNMKDMMEVSAKTGEIIDAKDMYGKFALDAIATSGFGIESNSFKDPDSVFRINALKVTRADPKYVSKLDIPKFVLQFIFPRLAQKLGITFLDKDATEFFMRIVRQTMKHRRETGVRRNDIVDILMDELDKDHDETLFTKEELEIGFVGTSVLFFFAGFDTTSTTLSLVVHALVHHPEVQELVRKEIEDVIGDDEEITADHLKELKFMENVIHESMRKYFGFAIQRTCTKDYKLPGTDFVIPKGLMVNIVPRPGDCFANPSNFDPGNFTESEKFNKIGFTGFGQGPRNCIGMRYALQALKLATIQTVRNFNLVKCDQTVEEDKLMFSIATNGFVGGIKFKVEKI